jgi:S-adenosylmethionine:tRNA ribosyltransferase-isomerase
MKLSQLNYSLPKDLIAHAPITPRDHSRLMIINRNQKTIEHKHFYDLPDLLTPNDVLVFNQTKVFPARLYGTKETGGKVEILLLKELTPLTWEAMYKGNLKINQKIKFVNTDGRVISQKENIVTIMFDAQPKGIVPLPPYINTLFPLSPRSLSRRYQTVYAKESGSVAAPTAGFHFTKILMNKLHNKGIQMEFVTLHIGAGTFLPIKEEDIAKHKMHSESFSISKETALRLNESKRVGKRIVAVGTTTTRVLETLGQLGELDINNLSGQTSIFIYPPYKFKFVDAIITNFHLPKSTLLALVYSFSGEDLIKKAYKEAIINRYRFYSFGDASFLI